MCTLYGLIKYVGKEVVNPLLLSYMAVGGSVSIKDMLYSTNMPIFVSLEEKKLFHLKIAFMELD